MRRYFSPWGPEALVFFAAGVSRCIYIYIYNSNIYIYIYIVCVGITQLASDFIVSFSWLISHPEDG